MKESVFTAKVCRILQDQGAVVLAFVGGSMQTRGIPDRFVAHPKWSGFLEFKGAATKLAIHQRLLIDKLVKRGVSCYIYRHCPNAADRIENTAGELVRTAEPVELLNTLQAVLCIAGERN